MSTHPAAAPVWHLYVPKLVTVLRRGYGPDDLRHDVTAGLTVAIVALPLAMALAIASGITPEVANRLDEVLNQFPAPPRVFILRLRLVPLIDSSGVGALKQLLHRCQHAGTRVILSGLREQPRAILAQMGVHPDGKGLQVAANFTEALARAS